MSVVPPTEIGFDRVGTVLRTAAFSNGADADGIDPAAASIAAGTEEIIVLIVLDVAGPILERPSLIVPAWESDQPRLKPIAIPIPSNRPMVQT